MSRVKVRPTGFVAEVSESVKDRPDPAPPAAVVVLVGLDVVPLVSGLNHGLLSLRDGRADVVLVATRGRTFN